MLHVITRNEGDLWIEPGCHLVRICGVNGAIIIIIEYRLLLQVVEGLTIAGGGHVIYRRSTG